MSNISNKEFFELLNQKVVKGEPGSPLYIKNAEIENINISDVVFENIVFDKPAIAFARFDRATFRNVTFKNCTSVKFRSDNAVMENVEFVGCRLKSFNPMGVSFSETTFKDTTIDSASFSGANGTVKIEKSKLINADIGDTEISWLISESALEKIDALGIKGRITLTNSTLKDANFEFGKMDSFESYDSTVDALGPGTINDKIIIKGGEIDWTGILRAPLVDIDNTRITRFSMRRGEAGNISIRNCKNAERLGFSMSKLESLTISDCALGYLGTLYAHVGELTLNNVSVSEEWEAEGSHFKKFIADNLTLSGKLEFQQSQVTNKHFNKVSISNDAALDVSGANFSFADGATPR